MKRSIRIFWGCMFALGFVIGSCEKDTDGGGETVISHYNESKSHKAGQNCMACHTSGGSGEGWFVTAGSVYDASKLNPYPNSTLKIFTGPNGTGALVKTIEVDGKGNFFTTESVNFGDGLYAFVSAPNGNVKHMNSKITNGQCNSCHGGSIDKIWID